jgi:hypothetical protein
MTPLGAGARLVPWTWSLVAGPDGVLLLPPLRQLQALVGQRGERDRGDETHARNARLNRMFGTLAVVRPQPER